MRIHKILSLSLLCALLTSCGLKGGLYRETEKAGDMNRVERAAGSSLDSISGKAVTPR